MNAEQINKIIGENVPSHPCSRCTDKDGLSKTKCVGCIKADTVNFTKDQMRKRVKVYENN